MKLASAVRRAPTVIDEPRRPPAAQREETRPKPASTLTPAYLRSAVPDAAAKPPKPGVASLTKRRDSEAAAAHDPHAPDQKGGNGTSGAGGKDAASEQSYAGTKAPEHDAKGKPAHSAPKKGERLERLASAQPVALNAITPPEVETGGAGLAVQAPRAPSTDHGFESPPEPRSHARPAPGGKRTGDPEAFGRALDAFREAMTAARQLHDKLVSDAKATVAHVQSTQDRLADGRQGELNHALSDLAQDLRETRGEFDRVADSTANFVDQREAQTRAAIQRAAASAFGALNGAKAQADAVFATHASDKDVAKSKADSGISSVRSAGDKASGAISGLDATKETEHPTNIDPMPSAVNEAINVRLPLRVPPRAKTYADEAGAEVSSLTATFDKMRKAIDEQFKSIAGQMKSTADSCAASIGSARTGALKQLAESSQQLHASIEETRANGHTALVNQHNQSRRQVIGAFRERAHSEDQAAQQRVVRGAAAALSLASGQQAGARSLAENLSREQERPADDFAKIVTTSARTLIGHVGKAGPEQRTRVLRSADAGEASALAQALATGARLATSTQQMRDRLAESGRSAGNSLSSQIAHSVEAFDQMPEPIRQALKGALRSATSSYASHNTQAGEKVEQAKGTVTGAMSGKGGGTPAEGTPAATPEITDSKAAKAKEVPDQFVTRATAIAGKPETDEGIARVLGTARTEVEPKIRAKASTLSEALNAFSTPVGTVMGALRNITQLQGAAISAFYAGQHHGDNLEQRLRIELYKTFSADSTNNFNIDAAINYLHGNHVAAALSEMKAAVNYSNEEGRVALIQRSLTPAELDQLRRKHPDELKEVLEDLDGTDRQVSFALNRIRPADPNASDSAKAAQERSNLEALAEANAYGLQHDIDKAREKRGEEGGDATADLIAGTRATLGDDVLSGGDPLTGAFEDREEAQARREKLWAATEKGFEAVVKTLPDGTPNVAEPGQKNPPSAIARYAAAARPYEEFVPDDSEAGGHYRTVSEGLDPRQTQLIDAIVKHGADSEDAAAATLAVELNRKSGKPKEDRLRKALGSDLLAAREGESDADRNKRLKDEVGPDGKVTKGDLSRSRDRRENILLKYAELTRGDGAAEPGTDPEARTKAADEVKNTVVNKLGDQLSGDPTAKAYTRSMVQNLEPDPVIAFDFALAHEEKNKETLLATTGRMNRDQIDDAVKRWDAKYPLGPPLYKRLGMFEHGSGALEGDARNETEISFMGVPRNDQERAEVANMATKQQVRDSGAGGRALASDEYQRMLNNQAKLLGLMGVKAEDIDQYGRIRKTGADGQPIHASFDKSGRLIVKTEGQRDEFEAAMQMSSLDAESYKQAVDRAAAGVVMALMVIAAAVTTFVTFGGAAAIWGPILVTAGAGLVGIAMTAAIRGDRYTRAEIERDLVMTFVQAATAGLGAYAGTAMRGAGAAAKAAASSEKLVGGIASIAEKEGVTLGAKALSMGKEVLIEAAVGGTTNGINSAAGAAMDPENRRQGKSGQKAFDSGIRGFLGGAVGSALTKPIGGLAKGFGKGGERVVGNVASGFGTRLTEARVGEAQGEPHQSWAESLEAAKEGIGQDVIRSLAEHGAEHYAEHREQRMRPAAVIGGGRGAPSTASHAEEPLRPPVEQRPPRELEPASKIPPETAGPQHSPESIARAQAVRESLPPELRSTVDSAVPAANGGLDPIAAPPPRVTTEPPAAPVVEAALAPPAARPGSGRSGEEPPEQQVAPAPRRAEEAEGDRPRRPPPREPHPEIPWAPADLLEGAVMMDENSHSRAEIDIAYRRTIETDPSREVAIYRNPVTGEHIMVFGDADSAFIGLKKEFGEAPHAAEPAGTRQEWKEILPRDLGRWELEAHYHPGFDDQHDQAPMARRLPSTGEGGIGDLQVLRHESQAAGGTPRSSVIDFTHEGVPGHTVFGADPADPKPYWINVENPKTGLREDHRFATPREYESWAQQHGAAPSRDAEGAPQARPLPGSGLPHDEELTLRHGTSKEDAESLRAAGIDPHRKSGVEEDLSRGFYMTLDEANAQEYARRRSGGAGGEVVSTKIRLSELGVVVDVREGGEHRAQWDAFLDREPPAYPAWAEGLFKNSREYLTGTGKLRLNEIQRGIVFEAFLNEAGLAHADAIRGDLGKGLTSGIAAHSEGEQIAIRSKELAAKLNERMGFGAVSGPPGEPVLPGAGKKMSKPVADAEEASLKKSLAATTEAKTGASSEDAAAEPKAKRERKERRVLDLKEQRRTEAEHARERQREIELNRELVFLANRHPDDVQHAREVLQQQRPEKPAEVTSGLQEIFKSPADLADRIDALDEWLGRTDLSDKARKFLEWQRKSWTFGGARAEAESTLAAAPQAKIEAEVRVKEADRARRKANLSIKELMERRGENFNKMKDTAKFDEILGKERFGALADERPPERPLKLSPDHLIPLTELSNMEELKPLLDLHRELSPAMKVELEKALTDLGDVRENLVAMRRDANEHMKGGKSWHLIGFDAAAEFGYLVGDVIKMQKREDAMRVEFKKRIAKLIAYFQIEITRSRTLSVRAEAILSGEDPDNQLSLPPPPTKDTAETP